MVEEMKKVKKVIERSQNIGLCCSPEFRKDSFPATLALFYTLKKLEKNVNFLNKKYPLKFNFLIKKERIHFAQADFLIGIKEAGTKISQLSYEKTDSGILLYLKTDGGELKKEDIFFQPLKSYDVLISVGVEKLEKIKALINEKPKFLINIDNQIENKNFGDVNIVEVSPPSLSEIIFEIIRLIDDKLFDREISNCLLCGIIQGTSNFQDLKINSQTFQKVSFLMEKGANFNELVSRLYGLKEETYLRLFGKVLSKIKIIEEKNLGLVVLKKEDFSEIKSSPFHLKFTLEKLSSSLFPFQNFLCLWESINSPPITKGVFYSPNKRMIEKFLENFAGEQKGNGILFVSKEPNIEEVKEKILKFL